MANVRSRLPIHPEAFSLSRLSRVKAAPRFSRPTFARAIFRDAEDCETKIEASITQRQAVLAGFLDQSHVEHRQLGGRQHRQP